MDPSIELRRGASENDDVVLLGGTPIEIEEGGEIMSARCEWGEIAPLTITPLPTGLSVRCWEGEEVLPYPFYEFEVSRKDEATVTVTFLCHHPTKYWEHRWGFTTWLDAVAKQVRYHSNFALIDKEVDDTWKTLTLSTPLPVGSTYNAALRERAAELEEIIREAEVALGGFEWRAQYEEDENLFSTEAVAPLLRRMGFQSVRYRHGTREYGKDFTFSEATPFGTLRHYGLQAKAGDVRGSVNAEIDEILGQLDDAFKMPYHELTSTESRYISTFVVAISGRFTDNAQEKIINKIAHGLHGSVYFLAGEQIRELIQRHWN